MGMRGVVESEVEEGTGRVTEGEEVVLRFLGVAEEVGTWRFNDAEGGEEKTGRELLGSGYESRARRPVSDFAAVEVGAELS